MNALFRMVIAAKSYSTSNSFAKRWQLPISSGSNFGTWKLDGSTSGEVGGSHAQSRHVWHRDTSLECASAIACQTTSGYMMCGSIYADTCYDGTATECKSSLGPNTRCCVKSGRYAALIHIDLSVFIDFSRRRAAILDSATECCAQIPAIVDGTVGGIVAVGIGVCVVVWFIVRKRRASRARDSTSSSEDPNQSVQMTSEPEVSIPLDNQSRYSGHEERYKHHSVSAASPSLLSEAYLTPSPPPPRNTVNSGNSPVELG
ncbi:hypothetical protein CSAL01_02641 [Colletotrichum salicis]|uniref:Uncharacterized protein n=1 Tax=Colletotrichum salicis TaxID=1209931 RepID=A0A135UET2_9PEZI|nr:hypothetical protein CSAL01_02641 [Colletotrichum salicis]